MDRFRLKTYITSRKAKALTRLLCGAMAQSWLEGWHRVRMLHWLKVRFALTNFVQILIVGESHAFPLSSDWLWRWHPQLHIKRFMHYADCHGLIYFMCRSQRE